MAQWCRCSAIRRWAPASPNSDWISPRGSSGPRKASPLPQGRDREMVAIIKSANIKGGVSKRIARTSERTIRRSEEHTSELQSHLNLVCRLLLEKKKSASEV